MPPVCFDFTGVAGCRFSVVHILSSGELLLNPDLEQMIVDRLFDRLQTRFSD
jgi:hypothetical protein